MGITLPNSANARLLSSTYLIARGVGGTITTTIAISLESGSIEESTDTAVLLTDRPSEGNFHFAHGANASFNPETGTWVGATSTDTLPVGPPGTEYQPDLPEEGAQTLRIVQKIGVEYSNTIVSNYVSNPAPVVSNLTVSEQDQRLTFVASCTTEGTFWAVISALEPSVAQIKAGQDSTGAAAQADTGAASNGTITGEFTGLTNGTSYNLWIYMEEPGGKSSAVVSGTGTPTDTPIPVSRLGSAPYMLLNTDVKSSSHTMSLSPASVSPDALLVVFVLSTHNNALTNVNHEADLNGTALELAGEVSGEASGRITHSVLYLRAADYTSGTLTITGRNAVDGTLAELGNCTVFAIEFDAVNQLAPVVFDDTYARSSTAPEAGMYFISAGMSRDTLEVADPVITNGTLVEQYVGADAAGGGFSARYPAVLIEDTTPPTSPVNYAINFNIDADQLGLFLRSK